MVRMPDYEYDREFEEAKARKNKPTNPNILERRGEMKVKCMLCKWKGDWKEAKPTYEVPVGDISLRCPKCNHRLTQAK